MTNNQRLGTLFCVLFFGVLTAQNPVKLVGLSRFGPHESAFSGGMAWEVNADGSGFNVLKHWSFPRIGQPQGNLLAGKDPYFYGFTRGYEGAQAALYFNRFKVENGSLQTLRILQRTDFSATNVSANFSLSAQLVLASDGFFYGCHNLDYLGTQVFRLSSDGQILNNIYLIPDFIGETAGIAVLPDGRLAVITNNGHNQLWVGQPDGSNWQNLHQFSSSGVSMNPFVTDAQGTLYGSFTQTGGVVHFFKIQPDGTQYSELASGALGLVTDLIMGQSGKPVAALVQNGQTKLWEVPLMPAGNLTLLAQGNLEADMRALLQAPDGHFYLHSWQKAVYRSGNGTPAPLQWIGAADPEYSDISGKLVLQNDRLYAWQAGIIPFPDKHLGPAGHVFSVDANGADLQEHIVLDAEPADGAFPSHLLRGAEGAYYGAVATGGSQGEGFIFRMEENGSAYTPIYQIPALHRLERLFEHTEGWLIGALYSWNSANLPTGSRIFRIKKDGSGYEDLAVFSSFQEPAASVAEGPDARLYWTRNEHLMRMNADGTEKTDLGAIVTFGNTVYDRVGRLERARDGSLYGWFDFTFELPGLDYGEGQWLFRLNADGSTAADKNMPVYGNRVIEGTDFNFYSRLHRFERTALTGNNFPAGAACIYTPQLSGAGNRLYGINSQAGQYLASDLRYFIPEEGLCTVLVPAAQLGFGSEACFEAVGTTGTGMDVADAMPGLWPNPAAERLWVTWGEGKKQWLVYGEDGRLAASGYANAPVWEISLENWPAGMYYLQVIGADGRQGGRKFMKR
jgi:hypothetical protein